jgi:hypothetical protein
MASQARRYKGGNGVDRALGSVLVDGAFEEFVNEGLIGLVLLGEGLAGVDSSPHFMGL